MQIYDYDHDSILVRLSTKEAQLLGGALYVALDAGDPYPDSALCPAAERAGACGGWRSSPRYLKPFGLNCRRD